MIRVRIAPSPTGNLHIGTARTALFNWLFAQKNKGEFILRIEDTDIERSSKKYEENIVESLKWLGLGWDGQIYRQSERLDIYEEYLKRLLDSGKVFWCHHAKEELEAENKSQMEKQEAPRHICEHKKTELGKQKGQIIRLKVDENSTRIIHFNDEIRGTIEWEERLLGDFSLAKDLRVPLYNFAAVIDDIEMEISHVIRGEDHISNTPKQILIYEALRQAQGKPLEIPIFAHLPLILNPDKTKLSKRSSFTSIADYQKDYLPDALINFIGFLGYTYGKEIINKDEMSLEFELNKVHKSGAVFNPEKLNWFNSQYIKNLPTEVFKYLVNRENISDPAITLITERLDKLSDIENFEYFWKEPEYDSNLLIWKEFSKDEVKKSLEESKNILNNWNDNKDDLRTKLDDLAKKLMNPSKSPVGDRGASRGLVYWPFRVALTGKEKSPDPIEVAMVLGKEEAIKRIETGIKKLS